MTLEVQNTLWGGFTAVDERTVEELIRQVLATPGTVFLDSREIVLQAILLHSEVQVFCRKTIPLITNGDDAFIEYMEHLRRIPCFETWCRSVRRIQQELSAADVDVAGDQAKDAWTLDMPNGNELLIRDDAAENAANRTVRVIESPRWYKVYLKTEHWNRLREMAEDRDKSCVLCGEDRKRLVTHHRHYHTVGQERMTDISTLCNSCHGMAHNWLKLRVPWRMPDAVRDLFVRENINFE